MKKSNALMLSYMIFLAIALLASIFFKWEGLDRIAMAATLSGCFFAMADLFDWIARFNTYFCKEAKLATVSLTDIYNQQLKFNDEMDKEFKRIKEKATPYARSIEKLAEIIEHVTKTIEEHDEERSAHRQSIKELNGIQTDIMKKGERSKTYTKTEGILMIIGFILFFASMTFERFFLVLNNYQSLATIIAFILIMLNYYLKDTIEQNARAELDKMQKDIERGRKELERLDEDFKKLNMAGRVDELTETIKKKDKKHGLRENEDDGQTENAQHE